MDSDWDELCRKFQYNEDFAAERLAQFFDSNRLLFEQKLIEHAPSEEKLEMFTSVAHGLAHTGRYDEAIPFAKACLSMYSLSELEKMGEHAAWGVDSARKNLIYSLFELGRRKEVLAYANDHLRIAPDDLWVRSFRDGIRIGNARHINKWLWHAGGILLVLGVGIQFVAGRQTLWLSAIGLTVVVSAFLMEKRIKKREVLLGSKVDRGVPPR